MRQYSIGAQGAKEVLRSSLRILAAILVSSLALSGISAQVNPSHSHGPGNQESAGMAPPQAGANPEVQFDGEIEILHKDHKDGHSSYAYSLKRSDGTHIPLQFSKEPPTHLLTGAHVRVTGHRSGGSLVLYSGGTSVTTTNTTSGDATGSTTSSIPVPYSFGVQSTLVILVNFQDGATQPYTTGDAYNMFFGTANNFFMENSYGQTSFTGDVVGWFTIPVSIATCDTSQIATAAQNAATGAGVNLSVYTRYVYAFPQNGTCGFAGASYVGGNPSQSWINGNTLQIATVTHELGHALGLWHSHSLDCGTAATVCSSGSTVEYGDLMDVMGASQPAAPHYNAFQKERLGWLNYGVSPPMQTVTTSGTYSINAYENTGSEPIALKVLKSIDSTTGAKTWYYIEARRAVGFDAFLTDGSCGNCWNQTVTNGVLVHIGTDGLGNSGDLLDMTPATPTYYWYFDPSLVAGQTFQDSTAGVTFTPTSVSSAGATVQITINGSSGSACGATNPSVSVSPSQSQSVTSGTAVSFSVSVKDNDGSSCPATTFNLGDTLPPGWTGVWSTSTLSLSPGKIGSATLTVTSLAGTADGSYNVNVNAVNAFATSYGASATMAYVINTAPLSISLTTNQSSYLPGQTVAITVTTLYGTLPDAGASVTATVTAPNGRATTLSATTGSNGAALLNYKLPNNASAGTYAVRAQAGTARSSGGRTKGGAAAASASAVVGASTSFIVQ